MHLGILAVVRFADLTFGALMWHLFTFDSAWLRPSGSKPEELVLFFDGGCGLCNALVDFAIQEDRQGRLTFAPLQGKLAGRKLAPDRIKGLESIVLLRDGVVLDRSDAVLELCGQLGGIWRLAGIFRMVPKPVRDAGYALVARNRYRWFGRKQTCRIPTPRERARFVD